MNVTHLKILFSSHRAIVQNLYNIHDYKTFGSPKPLLPVQLDHCHKPSETKSILREHSDRGVAKDGDTWGGSAWCHPVCVTHSL